MVAAACILPLVGILADTLRKHVFFLAIFTFGCIASTVVIGVSHNFYLGIASFALANFFNQVAANVFYPALLPEICSKEKIARASGLGVALGYVGTIVGLFVVRLFIRNSQYSAAFVPTAGMFFLFSLPCFLFVREAGQERVSKGFALLLKEDLEKFRRALVSIRSSKPAMRFFLAIFLAINGINGVLLNLGVYGKRVIGFADTELPLFIAVSTVFAFAGSFMFGFIVERFGAKRTLSYVFLGWVIALSAVAMATDKSITWVLGPCIGMLLAGTWVSSRPLIISLSPERRMGEFFGFSGLASISGALVSPLLWLLVITVFEPWGLVKYRLALITLTIMIAAGFFVLKGVSDEKFFTEE